MDAIDLNNISEEELENKDKNELIAIIEKLRNQRAYTYGDRMKLAMLDNAPFTIWANNRDCKIVLWDGKCESVYGYNKEVAVGRNFVDLIVSNYEKRKARIDCRNIIDTGTRFNNIANDVTFDKIPIILQTNCFKMKDVNSDEFLSVEFGVLTNSIKQETEKTEKAVAIEKMVETLIDKISTIGKEINLHKQNVANNNKKKLNTILDELSKLQSEHTSFEKECVEWDNYVEYINNFEKQVNTCESNFTKIKDAKKSTNSITPESKKLSSKDVVL